jgi:hypothetical protein
MSRIGSLDTIQTSYAVILKAQPKNLRISLALPGARVAQRQIRGFFTPFRMTAYE